MGMSVRSDMPEFRIGSVVSWCGVAVGIIRSIRQELDCTYAYEVRVGEMNHSWLPASVLAMRPYEVPDEVGEEP